MHAHAPGVFIGGAWPHFSNALGARVATAVLLPSLASSIQQRCRSCNLRPPALANIVLLCKCMPSPSPCPTCRVPSALRWLQIRSRRMLQRTPQQQTSQQQMSQQQKPHQQTHYQQVQGQEVQDYWLQGSEQQGQCFVSLEQRQQQSSIPQEIPQQHATLEPQPWRGPVHEFASQGRQRQHQPVARQLRQQQDTPVVRPERWKQQQTKEGEEMQQQHHYCSRRGPQELRKETRRQGGERAQHLSSAGNTQQRIHLQSQQLQQALHVAERSSGRATAQALWSIARILRPAAARRAAGDFPVTATTKSTAAPKLEAAVNGAESVSFSRIVAAAATGKVEDDGLNTSAPLHSLPASSLRFLFMRLLKQQLIRLTQQRSSKNNNSNREGQLLLPSDADMSLAALICLLSTSAGSMGVTLPGATGVSFAGNGDNSITSGGIDTAGSPAAGPVAAALLPAAATAAAAAPPAAATPAAAAAAHSGSRWDIGSGFYNKEALLEQAVTRHADEDVRVQRAFFAAALDYLLCDAITSSSFNRPRRGCGESSMTDTSKKEACNNVFNSDDDLICWIKKGITASSRMGSSNGGVHGEKVIHALRRAKEEEKRSQQTTPTLHIENESRDGSASPISSSLPKFQSKKKICRLSDNSDYSCFSRGSSWCEETANRVLHHEEVSRATTPCREKKHDPQNSSNFIFPALKTCALLCKTAAALRCVSRPLLRVVTESLLAVEARSQQHEEKQPAIQRRMKQQRRLFQQQEQRCLQCALQGRRSPTEETMQKNAEEAEALRFAASVKTEAVLLQQQPSEGRGRHPAEGKKMLALQQQEPHEDQTERQQQGQDPLPRQKEREAQQQQEDLLMQVLPWEQTQNPPLLQQRRQSVVARHYQRRTKGCQRQEEGGHPDSSFTQEAIDLFRGTAHALQQLSLVEALARENSKESPFLLLRQVSSIYSSFTSFLITNTSTAATAMRSLCLGSRRQQGLSIQAELPLSRTPRQTARLDEAAGQHSLNEQQPQQQLSEQQAQRISILKQEAKEQQQQHQQVSNSHLRLNKYVEEYQEQTFEQHQQEGQQSERQDKKQQYQPAKESHEDVIEPRGLGDFAQLLQQGNQVSRAIVQQPPTIVKESCLKGVASTNTSNRATLLPLETLDWLLRGRLLAARLICVLLRQSQLLNATPTGQQSTEQQDLLQQQEAKRQQQWLLQRDTQRQTIQQQELVLQQQEQQLIQRQQQLLQIVEQLARTCFIAVEPSQRLQGLLRRHQRRIHQTQLHWQKQQQRPPQDQHVMYTKKYDFPSNILQQKPQQRQQHDMKLAQLQSECSGENLPEIVTCSGSARLSPGDMLLLLQRLAAQEQEAQRHVGEAVLDMLTRLPETAFSASATERLLVSSDANSAAAATAADMLPVSDGAATTAAAAEVLRVSDDTDSAAQALPVSDDTDSAAADSNCITAADAAAGSSCTLSQSCARHRVSEAAAIAAASVTATLQSPLAAQASSIAWTLSRMLACGTGPQALCRRALDRLATALLSAAISHHKELLQQQQFIGRQQQNQQQAQLHHWQGQSLQDHNSLETLPQHVSLQERQHPHRALEQQVPQHCVDRKDSRDLNQSLPLTIFLGLKRLLNISYSLGSAGCFHEAFFRQLIGEMLTLLRSQGQAGKQQTATYTTADLRFCSNAAAEVYGASRRQATTAATNGVATEKAQPDATAQEMANGSEESVLTVDLLVSLLSTLGMLQLQHALLVEEITATLARQLQPSTAAAVVTASATSTGDTKKVVPDSRDGAALYGSVIEKRRNVQTTSSSSSSKEVRRANRSSFGNRDHSSGPAKSGPSDDTNWRSSSSSSRTCTDSSCTAASNKDRNTNKITTEERNLSDAGFLRTLSRVYVALARLQHKPPAALQRVLDQFMLRLAAAAVDIAGTTTPCRFRRHREARRYSVRFGSGISGPLGVSVNQLSSLLLREQSTFREVAAVGHSCAVLQCASPQLLLALRQIISSCFLPCVSLRGNAPDTSAKSTVTLKSSTFPRFSADAAFSSREEFAATLGSRDSAAVACSTRAASATSVKTLSLCSTNATTSSTAAGALVLPLFAATDFAAAEDTAHSLSHVSSASAKGVVLSHQRCVEDRRSASSNSTFEKKCRSVQTQETIRSKQPGDKGFTVGVQQYGDQSKVHLEEEVAWQQQTPLETQEKEKRKQELTEEGRIQHDFYKSWKWLAKEGLSKEQQESREQLRHVQKQREQQRQMMHPMQQWELENKLRFAVWKDGLHEVDLQRFVGTFLWTFAACNDVGHEVYVQLLQLAAALTHNRSSGVNSCAFWCAASSTEEAIATEAQPRQEQVNKFLQYPHQADGEGSLEIEKNDRAKNFQHHQVPPDVVGWQREQQKLHSLERQKNESLQQQQQQPQHQYQQQRKQHQQQQQQLQLKAGHRAQGTQPQHHWQPNTFFQTAQQHGRGNNKDKCKKGVDLYRGAEASKGLQRHRRNCSFASRGHSPVAGQVHHRQNEPLEELCSEQRAEQHTEDGKENQRKFYIDVSQERQLSAAEARWFTQIYYSFLAVAADLLTKQPTRFTSPTEALAAATAICGLTCDTVEVWKQNSCRSAHRPHLSQLQHRVKRMAEAASRRLDGHAFTVEMEVPICHQLGITVDIGVQLKGKRQRLPNEAEQHRTGVRALKMCREDSRVDAGKGIIAANTAKRRCADMIERQSTTSCVTQCTMAVPLALPTDAKEAKGVEKGQQSAATRGVAASPHGTARVREALNNNIAGGEKNTYDRLTTDSVAFDETCLAEGAGVDNHGSCADALAVDWASRTDGNSAEDEISKRILAWEKESTATAVLAVEVLGPSHFCISAATAPPTAIGAADARHHISQYGAAQSPITSSSTSSLPWGSASWSQQLPLQVAGANGTLDLPQSHTSTAAYMTDAGLKMMQLSYSFDGGTALKQRLLQLSGKPCLFLSFLLLEKVDDEHLQHLLWCVFEKLLLAPRKRSRTRLSSPLELGDKKQNRYTSSINLSLSDPDACLSKDRSMNLYNPSATGSSLSCSTTMHKCLHSSMNSNSEAGGNLESGNPPDRCREGTCLHGQTARGSGDRRNKNVVHGYVDISSYTGDLGAFVWSHSAEGGVIPHQHHFETSCRDIRVFGRKTERGNWNSANFSSTWRLASSVPETVVRHGLTRATLKTTRAPCEGSDCGCNGACGRFSRSSACCYHSSCRWLRAVTAEGCCKNNRCCESFNPPRLGCTVELRQPVPMWKRDTLRVLLLSAYTGGRTVQRCADILHRRNLQRSPTSCTSELSSAKKCGDINADVRSTILSSREVPCISICSVEVTQRSKVFTSAAAAVHMSSYMGAKSRSPAPSLQSVMHWWPAGKIEDAGCRKSHRNKVSIESCSEETGYHDTSDTSRMGNGWKRSSNHSRRSTYSFNVSGAATVFHKKTVCWKDKRGNKTWSYYRAVQRRVDRRNSSVLPRALAQAWGPAKRVLLRQRSNVRGRSPLKLAMRRVSLHFRDREVVTATAAAALQLQRNYEQLLLRQESLPLMLRWLHAMACRRQADLEKQGYEQPQRALLQQLQQQKTQYNRKQQQSLLLLMPQPCIYAVVESIRDTAPLLLLGACPSDQAPAIHFLTLAAAASSSAAIKSWESMNANSSRRRDASRKGWHREDTRCQGLLLGQTLRAGRFEQQRVDAWLSTQWDAIQHQKQQQQRQQYPLVLYMLEALPMGEAVERLPFKTLAQDRLAAWEQILTSVGLPGSVSDTGFDEEEKMQLLIPPPYRYMPASNSVKTRIIQQRSNLSDIRRGPDRVHDHFQSCATSRDTGTVATSYVDVQAAGRTEAGNKVQYPWRR